MLKSFMSYYDILFPINLGPLTYKCPEELLDKAHPGMIVSAPLKNKLTKGIIFSRNFSPPDGRIKDISKIHDDFPVLSKGLLKLIGWMSDYYLAPEGLVLKQSVPREIFIKTKVRKIKEKPTCNIDIEFIDIPETDLSSVLASVSYNKYQTFLLHSPTLLYQYSLTAKLLNSCRNVLILLPEISQSNMLYNSLKGIFKDRICILHSEMSGGMRTENIEGIISGKHDIVLGTRSALFAPLKTVSLIIVLNEHSSSYKPEEGIRYNMRDIAVMRGFIEKAAVLLSSVTPSVDSYFNSIANKYRLIKPAASAKRPRVRIIDMRFEKIIRPQLSKTVFDSLKNRLNNGKKIMLVINRRGYSTLLLCNECGHTENCPACNIPLILHKHEKSLKCHYCGTSIGIPEKCSRCGSFNLDLLGSGTQRMQENIKELFGVDALRFDSDKVKKKSEVRELMQHISDNSAKVIIGTKMLTKRMAINERISLAAVFNTDITLNLPDFRSSEKAYAELSSIIGLVEPDGQILIQTRFPQNSLFRYFKADDYESFVKEELSKRTELSYPPYSKMLNLRFSCTPSLLEKIIMTIREASEDIEVFGPATVKTKKGETEFSILLKSRDRKILNTTAKTILKKFRDTKDINIRIDIDPL